MKKFYQGLAVSVLTVCSHAAFAGADCAKAPKDKWLSELDMQKKIVNEYSFAIKKFKIDGDCYEIYGFDHSKGSKNPPRVEVYFDPVTGEIVKRK